MHTVLSKHILIGLPTLGLPVAKMEGLIELSGRSKSRHLGSDLVLQVRGEKSTRLRQLKSL